MGNCSLASASDSPAGGGDYSNKLNAHYWLTFCLFLQSLIQLLADVFKRCILFGLCYMFGKNFCSVFHYPTLPSKRLRRVWILSKSKLFVLCAPIVAIALQGKSAIGFYSSVFMSSHSL